VPAPDAAAIARANFADSERALRAAGAVLDGAIAQAASMVVACYRQGGTVFAFGNGGSAAEAQHFVGELVGRFKDNRKPLAGIVLPTDLASLTCIANDFSYDDVFARPLEALARPGDLVVGLSTSGRSPSVVKAMAAARSRGLATIAFIGAGESPLSESDLVIRAPSTVTARIQEVHTVAIHALTEAVEAILFGPASG
jgi:D-sedoheptulose 7-phosphate isomerase